MKITPLMDRWPRTSLLVLLFLSTVVTLGLTAVSVRLLGIYGPIYLGIVGVLYVAISAVLGDIKDRKKP